MEFIWFSAQIRRRRNRSHLEIVEFVLLHTMTNYRVKTLDRRPRQHSVNIIIHQRKMFLSGDCCSVQ